MEQRQKESVRGTLRSRFVGGLAVCSAVISPLLLMSCPSAFASGQQHGLSIKVFTSPDDQFWNNYVIVEGEHQEMLVDAQLTKRSDVRLLHENKKHTKQLPIMY